MRSFAQHASDSNRSNSHHVRLEGNGSFDAVDIVSLLELGKSRVEDLRRGDRGGHREVEERRSCEGGIEPVSREGVEDRSRGKGERMEKMEKGGER